MFKSITTRSYDSQTFVTIMFWVVFILDMLMWMPNINKSNAIYFPFVYFAAYAIDLLLQRPPWK